MAKSTAIVTNQRENCLRYWKVASGTVITKGDLVVENPASAGYIIPAASLGFCENLELTQIVAAALFVGIAEGASLSGETFDIPVTEAPCMVEMDCASSTFAQGALIGFDDNTGGTALENTQVIEVNKTEAAIGRVAYSVGTADTKVRVDLFPRKTDMLLLTIEYAATGNLTLFNANCPFRMRVANAWHVRKGTTAGTAKLTDGTNDITDTLSLGTTDAAKVEHTKFYDDYYTLAKGASLVLTIGTGAAEGVAYVLLQRM